MIKVESMLNSRNRLSGNENNLRIKFKEFRMCGENPGGCLKKKSKLSCISWLVGVELVAPISPPPFTFPQSTFTGVASSFTYRESIINAITVVTVVIIIIITVVTVVIIIIITVATIVIIVVVTVATVVTIIVPSAVFMSFVIIVIAIIMISVANDKEGTEIPSVPTPPQGESQENL